MYWGIISLWHCNKRKNILKIAMVHTFKITKNERFDYVKKSSTNDKMNILVFNWNIVKVNEIKQPWRGVGDG